MAADFNSDYLYQQNQIDVEARTGGFFLLEMIDDKPN